MAGLPVSEALVLHVLKSEIDGTLFTPSVNAGNDRSGRAGRQKSATTIALVATQRAPDELIEQVEDFIEGNLRSPVKFSYVVGDTSILERRAAQFCQDREIPVTIVAKAVKGEWDEGSEIRDERVVALVDMVYAFDSSARTRSYEQLCKRQRKPFHRV